MWVHAKGWSVKKFHADDLHFIYFLLPRSFIEDIALAQSLQSNGSFWQICELQHFIRQGRTKDRVLSQLFSSSFIYCWSISSDHTVKVAIRTAVDVILNRTTELQFGQRTLCPDGCAMGSLCGADICLLWRSSSSSAGTQAGARALSVFTLSLPRRTWNLVGSVVVDLCFSVSCC